MTGTDHPPSTASPTHPSRRALATGLAIALAILTAVALASASGGPDLAGAAVPEPSAPAEDLSARAALRPTLADVEEIAEAIAPPTTTTTVPPPTTTTTTSTAPAPPPPPPPPPTVSGTGYSDPGNPAAWDRLAQCESGGNWAISTGNGYYGGLQFSLSSWQAVGGTGYPHEHSRETQIAMGQRLWQQGGWAHWPGCSRQLGYR